MYIYMYMPFFGFPSHLCHHRALSRSPCAIQYLLISYLFYVCVSSVAQSCLNLFRPHGLQLTRLLCPWNSPGKNTGVGCRFLLQGIFLTQGSNSKLLHCRRISYHWVIGEALASRISHWNWHYTVSGRWILNTSLCPSSNPTTQLMANLALFSSISFLFHSTWKQIPAKIYFDLGKFHL